MTPSFAGAGRAPLAACAVMSDRIALGDANPAAGVETGITQMIQSISPTQSAIWVARRSREPFQFIVEMRKRCEAAHEPPPPQATTLTEKEPMMRSVCARRRSDAG